MQVVWITKDQQFQQKPKLNIQNCGGILVGQAVVWMFW